MEVVKSMIGGPRKSGGGSGSTPEGKTSKSEMSQDEAFDSMFDAVMYLEVHATGKVSRLLGK